MPADIRSFFGGKGSQGSQPQKAKVEKQSESTATKRKRPNARKVVDDSDEDDFEISTKKTTPKKSTPQKRAKKESPKGEETSTSAYFESNAKRKSGRPTIAPTHVSPSKENIIPSAKSTPQKRSVKPVEVKKTPQTKTETSHRVSPRKKKTTNYAEVKEDDFDTSTNGIKENGGDISATKNKRVHKATRGEHEEEEEEKGVASRRKSNKPRKQASLVENEDEAFAPDGEMEFNDEEFDDRFTAPVGNDERIISDKSANGQRSSAHGKGRKRKPDDLEDDDDDDDDFEIVVASAKKRAKSRSPARKGAAKTPRAPSKKVPVEDSKEMQGIFESIPTVRPPTPPPKSGESRKFNFQNQAQRAAPPPAAGSKEPPVGAENCLAGLTFVFTGILESLGRDEGQELVKRYGGKVTTSPSTKTSYVVLGDEAGPKKLDLIRKHNIKTIKEEGLFELIRRLPANGGDSAAATKFEENKKKEEEKVKQMAAEMEKEERRAGGAGGAGGGNAGKSSAATSGSTSDGQLWTSKYAPSAINHICGNKGQVEKLQRWLREWPKNLKINFKKPGKDGSFSYRAVIIHGPPGIGKTTAAHIVAKLEGYDILESNASDTRSKKLVETGLKGVLDNTSLFGYFAGDNQAVNDSKKKLVLVMDEVDGMSAGDRGGVGALAQVVKKTNIPMILICNERRQPKMKPFDFVTYDLPFRRPTVTEIRSRMSSICYRENMKLPPQLIDALIEGSHSDIRQIINMISTVKLDQEAMSFDKGVSMSKAWEKHIILKPWDIAQKLLSAGWFAPNSNKTLNDKIELYFNDHEFSYLMLQENYLKTTPSIASRETGRERNLKALELADKAAESISDGDLVDRIIHGSQQQWSLMPTHAVFSFVRPASFVYGSLGGHTSFTSWLGNNSKQGKLTRYVKEIQGHMRLRASGDRHEIRQQYLPTLWTQLVRRMQVDGKEAVADVIELLDSYFLTKDDYDAIVELGLGPMDMDKVSIDTQTKSTFTRLYNQQSHPLPFMKASNVVAPKKLSKEKPDLEEAIEESDEGEDLTADKQVKQDEEEDLDVSKDKYVKQPKKKVAGKKAPSNKPTAKKKAKNKDVSDEESPASDSDVVKSKKGSRTKGKASTAKGKNKR
ncbi:MAG: hypothetical protein M1837_005527 [Sclerophora amabilis]|nr:MAG: hypothetical protein M1837_005527 [Sclerophora amabilis]